LTTLKINDEEGVILRTERGHCEEGMELIEKTYGIKREAILVSINACKLTDEQRAKMSSDLEAEIK